MCSGVKVLLIMKNLFVASWLFSVFFCPTVLADAGKDLQNRLDKVNSFHADFSQVVTGANGVKVQEGEGKLSVKRPNLFNWSMIQPDESVLISDGETLWFYNPLVEQATATWLKNATGNTSFLLITRNNSDDWKQYKVSQKGDDFVLIPKSNESNLKQFKISVTQAGTIKSFAIIEQDGQQSVYRLKGQQNSTTTDAAKFKFTVPQGVTLDDQRN